MILVLNLNASVDKRYALSDLKKGEVQRAVSVENTAGGKGIHVAHVASLLGADVLTTGFVGGHAGAFLEERMKRRGLAYDFAHVAGETRACLAILTADGAQTEILEPGPRVSEAELAAFRKKFSLLLEKADVVVASGSLPQGVPKELYAALIRETHAAQKPFLLDTSGEALARGIEAEPDFIKPNKDEIEALTGRPARTEADVRRAAEYFFAAGVRCVCISLGAAGSLACTEGGVYRVTVPEIACKNPVGSGDSYVGGFAVALAEKKGIEDALRLAAACGTANALEEESGFVRPATVRELQQQIRVAKLR